MTSEAKNESQPILTIDLTDEKNDGGVEIWPNFEDISSDEVSNELESGELNLNNQNIVDVSTSKSLHSSDLNSGVGTSKADVHEIFDQSLNSLKFNGSTDTITAHQINESWKPPHWQSYDSYLTKVCPVSAMPGTSYSLGPVPGTSKTDGNEISDENSNSSESNGSSKTLDYKGGLPRDISWNVGASHPIASSSNQSTDNILPFDTDIFGFDSEEYSHWISKQELEFNKELDQKPSETEKRLIYHVKNVTFPSIASQVNEEKLFDDDLKSLESLTSSAARVKRENINLNTNALKEEYSFPQLEMIEAAPITHKYYSSDFQPNNPNFLTCLNRERRLLQNDLPPGIYVKMFEDRMDLMSALIEGPTDTPYEGCLFTFDIQLSPFHPSKPPQVHYWAFCNTKLNPNLYTNGRVCLSLLGTWPGNKHESWSNDSSIYQLLISIQGLILVKEPIYNEPLFYEMKGTLNFDDHAKRYNYKILEQLIESIIRQIQNPPLPFKDYVISFYRKSGLMSLERFEKELELFDGEQLAAEKHAADHPNHPLFAVFNHMGQPIWPSDAKKELESKINIFYYVFAKFINNN